MNSLYFTFQNLVIQPDFVPIFFTVTQDQTFESLTKNSQLFIINVMQSLHDHMLDTSLPFFSQLCHILNQSSLANLVQEERLTFWSKQVVADAQFLEFRWCDDIFSTFIVKHTELLENDLKFAVLVTDVEILMNMTEDTSEFSEI